MYWIVAFALGFIGDFIWAKSAENVSKGNPVRSATWLMLFNICAFTCVYFISEKQFVLVLFYLVGAWIGTFVAVRFQKIKKPIMQKMVQNG